MEALQKALDSPQAQGLVDDCREALTKLKELGFNEFRPWSEFFHSFKAPAQWKREPVEERVVTNFLHYRTNYLMIACGSLLFTIITSPMLIFILLASAALFFFFMIKQPGTIVIQGQELDEPKKLAACGAATLLMLVLSGQFLRLLGVIALVVLLLVAHMVFRPRSTQSKFNRLHEETKLSMAGLFGGKGKDTGDLEDAEGGGARPDDQSEATSTGVNRGQTGNMRQRGAR